MKVIFLAAVLAVVSATYSYSSEEDFYYVNKDDRKMEQTESDLDNTAGNVQLVYQESKSAKRIKPGRGPPYPNTYFAAYREKVMSSEMQPYSDYLRDVPKQSAYNPIRYSTYFQQNAKQDDYVVGVSDNS